MEDQSKIDVFIEFAWIAMFSLATILIFFSFNYRVKLLRKEKEKEIIEKEKQIIAFKASIEAEENQKERIANNLHDDIIPLLTALGQNIKHQKKDYYTMKLSALDFDKNAQIVDQSIKRMRAIALDLIPTTFLNFGLIKALEEYAKQLNNSGRLVEIDIKTNIHGELPFSKPEQINIYRMCLEILNNLQKHADYTCLRITVENDETSFRFKFVHDGKAINNEEIELLGLSSAGLGLKSLKSRALILNATIDYSNETNVPSITITAPFNS